MAQPFVYQPSSNLQALMYATMLEKQKELQNAEAVKGRPIGGGDPTSSLLDAIGGYLAGDAGVSALASEGAAAAAPYGVISTTAGTPVATAGSAEAAATPVLGELGGAWDLAGIGAEGNLLAPVAGVIGTWDLFKNKRKGVRGALQGAGSGAAIGSYFGLPGALIGGGVGLAAGLGNNLLFKKSISQIEKDRWEDLVKDLPATKGLVAQVKAGRKSEPNYKGRTDKTSAPDFVSTNPQGAWVNNKFASSRKESDLRPEDIWMSQDIIRAGGSNYGDWSPEAKRKLSEEALSRGMIREKRGGLYAKSDTDLEKLAREIEAAYGRR